MQLQRNVIYLMLSPTARKPVALSETQAIAKSARNAAARRIWLPRLLYDALPYFYFFSGVAALFATLYVSEWFWILPHSVLFSAACLHFAAIIFSRRRKISSPQSGTKDSSK